MDYVVKERLKNHNIIILQRVAILAKSLRYWKANMVYYCPIYSWTSIRDLKYTFFQKFTKQSNHILNTKD